MKTKKLKIEDLKVKSFVTAIDVNKEQTVKGGSAFSALCPPQTILGALCATQGGVAHCFPE